MRSVGGESAELRVVVADGVGEGMDGLPEGRELVGERGDAAVRGGLLVVLDDGAECGVTVDRGPGDPGVFGDRGDSDGVAVSGEVGAGSFSLSRVRMFGRGS